jgi:hypothetical protein
MKSKQQSRGNQPAGGLGSKVVVEKPVRTGQPASGIYPSWASQVVGNKVTESASTLAYRGEPMKMPRGPAGSNQPLGNAVAAATKCGVGGSRTIYSSGSQGGMPVTPRAVGPTRDTMAEFGPDTSNARNRR